MKTSYQVALMVLAMVSFTQAFAVSIRPEKKAPKPKAVTTASGLSYVDLKVGTGRAAGVGDTLIVHYTGWLKNGTVFDSSIRRQVPFKFTLGKGLVIKGWEEGILGMKVGGKRKLTLPPRLAYGDQGAGGVIPPKSVLIFEIELLRFDRQ